MEKFTIEEKENLLNAMDHYIDAGEHTRNILTGEDKDRFTQEQWKIKDLRVKLILDLYPIVISGNNQLIKTCCPLCSNTFRPGVPEWAFLNTKQFDPICEDCFEKYLPKLFESTQENNKKYWMKEYPDKFNPDSTLKNLISVNDDSLPF